MPLCRVDRLPLGLLVRLPHRIDLITNVCKLTVEHVIITLRRSVYLPDSTELALHVFAVKEVAEEELVLGDGLPGYD